MIEERMFFGVILLIIIVTFVFCESSMRWHLQKWLLASLVMPILVVIFQSSFGRLILFFWPGSIVLMSLGASEKPWSTILHAWGGGITLNLGLYFILGLISYFILCNIKKKNEHTKT
jgi:hypothetical protein